MQEQTCWGSHALGAGHPVAGDAAHELEGLWAGRDGEGNAWNNKLGHFIFTKKLICCQPFRCFTAHLAVNLSLGGEWVQIAVE